MNVIPRLFLTLIFAVFVGWYAYGTAQTFYWTETGHCCGSPFFVGTDWDDCMPVQDDPTKIHSLFGIGDTYCDQRTWKRKPRQRSLLQ